MFDDPVIKARKLLSRISPGPWTRSGVRSTYEFYGHVIANNKGAFAIVGYSDRDHVCSLADADLMAMAPSLIKELADEVERLRKITNE